MGIIAVYWLVRVGNASRGGAVLASAATALLSPSFLLLPVFRRDSPHLVPQRLHTLMAYGEGPHISALCVLPFALALSILALRKWRPVAFAQRMVRDAIGSALPKPRKKTERPRWKLKAAVEFVDAVLEADRKAPRKQRHTAHRIWERILHELPDCKIGERTVRQYVHHRKIALGMLVRETCVPQSYAWGVEAGSTFWGIRSGRIAFARMALCFSEKVSPRRAWPDSGSTWET